jgi:cytochrome c oxidase subunit 4
MTTEASAEHSHAKPARYYVLNILFLLVLLLITVGASYVDLGSSVINVGLMLTIAFIKTLAILLVFMHVYWSSRLTMAFVVAGFFWLAILFCFTFTDYVTRPDNTRLVPSQIEAVAVDHSTPASH